MNFDRELDTTGLSCPLPLLKTKKSLADMSTGQILKIISTDKGSVLDIPVFAHQSGNALISSAEENGSFIFFMRKK